jgi:hypothetical protein
MATNAVIYKILPKIAILHGGNARAVEGLQIAWEKFGFEVVIAHNATDLADVDWKYIWADIPFLKANLACLRALLNQDTWTVLVPYDTLHPIHQIPELDSAPQFIPLPRPLIWHSFSQRIAMAKKGPVKSENSRMVRFATTVDFVDGKGETESQKPTAKNFVIMLVEDNPVCHTFYRYLQVKH